MPLVLFEVSGTQTENEDLRTLYASSLVASSQHTLVVTTIASSSMENCTLWIDYLEYVGPELLSSSLQATPSSPSSSIRGSQSESTVQVPHMNSSSFATELASATLPAQEVDKPGHLSLVWYIIIPVVLVPSFVLVFAFIYIILYMSGKCRKKRTRYAVEPYTKEQIPIRVSNVSDGE